MKTVTKKLIVFTLVIALAFMSLTGCKQKEPAADVNTGNADTGASGQGSAEVVDTDTHTDDAGPVDELIEEEDFGSMISGGWNIGIASGSELPESIKEAFDKAMAGLDGVAYEPVAYMGSQVVAGMNHAILCKATPVVPKAVTSLKMVIIYADLNGGAEVTSVADFNVGDFNTGELNGDMPQAMRMGGWGVSPEEACELTEGAAEAFEAAVEGYEGCRIEPLAVVGSQIVAGMNYAYVCRFTTVSLNPASDLKVIIVYRNLGGESVITAIEPLKISAYR